MKLYYTPGACSLSPHIALREANLPFELVQVDLREKRTRDGADFVRINPKGYVPALGLDDGLVITEGAVIVQYIADRVPDAQLAPPPGTFERIRLQEWLNFIATELHKGFGPISNPKAGDDLKRSIRERLDLRFAFLAQTVDTRPFLLGQRFTVADGYAYYTLRNLRQLDATALERSHSLKSYFERIGSRPAVRAALTVEGLS